MVVATKRTFKNLEETVLSFGQQMVKAIAPIAVSGSYAHRYAVEMESNYWMSLLENEQPLENTEELDYYTIGERSYVMAWDVDRFGGGR